MQRQTAICITHVKIHIALRVRNIHREAQIVKMQKSLYYRYFRSVVEC